MVGKVPEQATARKTYGDGLIDDAIEHPTLNQRCWRCAKHHGLACSCTGAEKREWVEEHGKRFPFQVNDAI